MTKTKFNLDNLPRVEPLAFDKMRKEIDKSKRFLNPNVRNALLALFEQQLAFGYKEASLNMRDHYQRRHLDGVSAAYEDPLLKRVQSLALYMAMFGYNSGKAYACKQELDGNISGPPELNSFIEFLSKPAFWDPR